MSEQDYRALLVKYIDYIRGCEGVDYITDHDNRHEADARFTDEQWAELERLAEEARTRRAGGRGDDDE